MPLQPEISHLRQQIDDVDLKILKLISDRGNLASEIGKLKHKDGKNILVPSREKLVLDRIIKNNPGPYKTEALLAIYRELISVTRALEAPLKISYLGPEATYTHMATSRYFGSSVDTIAETSILSIFEEVERGHTDYGVVPIENSTEGVVNLTLDQCVETSLKVCAEIILKITHCLLSKEKLSNIKTVYSHPQALAQCRQWVARHLPKASVFETGSTTLAVIKALEEKGAAAIASEMASNVYKLPLLYKGVQDQHENYTRFWVMGHHDAQKTGHDKTSLLFIVSDKAGALHHILGPVAEAKINLTKIESRPLKKKAWQYVFFMDLEGHESDPKIAKVLPKIKKQCQFFKVLGSYPKSRIIE